MTEPILASIPQTILSVVSSYLSTSSKKSPARNAIIYDVFARVVLANTENAFPLFLDMDGVLLPTPAVVKSWIKRSESPVPNGMTPAGWTFSVGLSYLHKKARGSLFKILRSRSVAVVFCSARRSGLSVLQLREIAKDSFGPYIISKTVDQDDPELIRLQKSSLSGLTGKAPEIQYWLQEYGWLHNKYAVIDDVPDGLKEPFGQHYVQTDPTEGLTEENANQVLKLI